jgi:hypothetical protein
VGLHWRCNFKPNRHGQSALTLDGDDMKRHEFGTPRPETAQLEEPDGQMAQSAESL